jgi:hypothetical protein
MPEQTLLASCFMLVSYSSALKMEAVSSSETSVDFQRTTRRYIPEDRNLHTAVRTSKPLIGKHTLLAAYFMLVSLLFFPEDGDNVFLRNFD